uniref:RNA polymerase sigma factor n=1 Tax=Herbidospora sakaeratensis TaxID=564415 RepID=UPI00078228AB|nr:sigma-70 family RNA polymerase sigma factor [Herbidospora sakaeratensis]
MSDRDLLEIIASGEGHEEAFETLWRRHEAVVRRTCRIILKSDTDLVDDAVSETALRIYRTIRKPGKAATIASFPAYAGEAARNICNTLLAERIKIRLTQEPLGERGEFLDRNPEHDPVESLLDHDAIEIVVKALRELPAKNRMVTWATFMDSWHPGGTATTVIGTRDSDYQARSEGRRQLYAALRVYFHDHLATRSCPDLTILVGRAAERSAGGRIPPTDLKLVVKHMFSCSACRETEPQRVRQALRASPFLLTPEGLRRIQERLRLVSAETRMPARTTYKNRPPAPKTGRTRPRSRDPRRPVPKLPAGLVMLALLGFLFATGHPQQIYEAAFPSTSESAAPGPVPPRAAPETRPTAAASRGTKQTAHRPREEGPDEQPDQLAEPPHDDRPNEEPAQNEPIEDTTDVDVADEDVTNEDGAEPPVVEPPVEAPEPEQPPSEDTPVDTPVAPPEEAVMVRPDHELTVRVVGVYGAVTVSHDGTDAGGCAQSQGEAVACSFAIPDGAQVTITVPDGQVDWITGACAGADSACVFTMSHDRVVKVHNYVPG